MELWQNPSTPGGVVGGGGGEEEGTYEE